MTEREKLQIKVDLLIDEMNRVEKQIETIDYAAKEEKMIALQYKYFKYIDEDNSTMYFSTNKLVIDIENHSFKRMYITTVKFFAESKLLYDCELEEEDFEDLIEISKEEFLVEYNKIINHYNTLINGTKDNI